ncbi:MAG TPA: carboxypeptidase-like regulatory domain-containing protein [Longimicrobium sp.]|uniref:carboxypeptidase-like regulatory domain-containing protein n=1 Tax=Longimicrobium sp. TaxID=2029185 RepID=UPI002ED80A71
MPCLLAVVLLAAGVPARAQTEARISGRVLDARGGPVPEATVRAASQPGGAQRATRTDARGAYSLSLPVGESYELSAGRVGYYEFTATLLPGAGQTSLTRDLQLTSRSTLLDVVEVRSPAAVSRPPAAPAPGGREEAGMAAYDLDMPLVPGDLAALAGLERGVLALGEGGGVSIAGQPASQTSVTLDGASFGATMLPPEALRSTAVVTSTYDPSRGQFSGGQVAATTLNGTNVFGGVARLRLGHPALQAPGHPQSRLAQASGGAGGALVRDRLFWYAAAQGTDLRTPLVTLRNAGPRLLAGLGVNSDSARRLRDIAAGLVPPAGEPAGQGGSRTGSGLLRLDYAAGNSDVLMLRLDGRRLRLAGLGESPLVLPGSGADVSDEAGGALAQWTSYRLGRRNELRVYHGRGLRRVRPARAGPAARVWVADAAADGEGAGSSALLGFGGSALAASRSRTELWEVSDELLLRAGSGEGRVKLGILASREETAATSAGDPFGTFTYSSLAELQAGRASLFTRSLGARSSGATAEHVAGFAAHLWHPHGNLAVLYGVRVEARRYQTGGSAAEPLPPGLSAAVPSHRGASPRVGFTWQAPSRAWSVRGGIGEFRGRIAPGSLAESGRGPAQLLCVGPAAPLANWVAYADDPGAVPDRCADGSAHLASRAPRTTVYARDFAPPRTWRASAAWDWSGRMGGRGMAVLALEASWVRGLSNPVAWDRNLPSAPGLVLGAEGGRPVWVPPAFIDPSTGGLVVDGARPFTEAGAVREVSGRGRSGVVQLSGGATLLGRRLDVATLYYTWNRGWDEVGALEAPGGASRPVAAATPATLLRGPSDLDRRHLVQFRYTRPVARWAELGLAGRATSGAPYTPLAGGDVNGDGAANDPAFVIDPAAWAEPREAAAMQALLTSAPAFTRGCLRRQLGRVAGRNSCRTQWAAELDVQANLWPAQAFRARRLTLSLTATNVLGGVDRLVHGRDGVRGWGGGAIPDPVLLNVRGFDPERSAFRYDVNPGFGGARRERVPGRPFTVVVQGRWALGADPVRQPLRTMFNAVRAQGRTAAQLREQLALTVPNLPAQVLALDDTLALALSDEQRERLRAGADSLGARLAVVVDTLARTISAAESGTRGPAADQARHHIQQLADEAQLLLDASRDLVASVLTGAQWTKLPQAIQQPSRQILPDRGPYTLRTGETW